MGAAGGIAVAGANMWALLLDKDQGHSAAASDLAIDVVDQKLKKAAAVVQVEKAPPAVVTVAKPAKRGDKSKKNTKSATRCGDSKQQAANVHDGKVQINGVAGDNKHTATPDTVPELADDLEEISVRLAEMLSREEAQDTEAKEEMFHVVTARGGRRRRTVGAPARGRKVAPVQEDVAAGGANMWALLLDKDPGHSAAAGDLAVDVLDQKLRKAAAAAKPAKRGQMVKRKKGVATEDNKAAAPDANGVVHMNGARGDKQTAPPAATLDGSSKVRIDGAGGDKQTTEVPDGDELNNGLEEIKETLAALLSIKEAEVEEEPTEEMFNVVAAGGAGRWTVATRTSKAAVVAEGTTVMTGTNMWALLSDNDPGHGAAKPAKQGKKTKKIKKKKKKNAAGGSKNAEATVDEDEDEALAGEFQEDEMTDEAGTGGSRCGMVVSRICKAAVVLAMLALPFQFTLTLWSHA